MWAGFGLFTQQKLLLLYERNTFEDYYNTSFDTLDIKNRGPIQSKSARNSHSHSESTPVRRVAGMRPYSVILLSASTIKLLRDFKTYVHGTLPVLLTIMDLNLCKALS